MLLPVKTMHRYKNAGAIELAFPLRGDSLAEGNVAAGDKRRWKVALAPDEVSSDHVLLCVMRIGTVGNGLDRLKQCTVHNAKCTVHNAKCTVMQFVAAYAIPTVGNGLDRSAVAPSTSHPERSRPLPTVPVWCHTRRGELCSPAFPPSRPVSRVIASQRRSVGVAIRIPRLFTTNGALFLHLIHRKRSPFP